MIVRSFWVEGKSAVVEMRGNGLSFVLITSLDLVVVWQF